MITSYKPSGFRAGHFRESHAYHVVRPSGTRDWLFFYTKRGKGLFNRGTGAVTVEPGSAVLIPPGVPHDYGIPKNGVIWEFYWSHFTPHAGWLPLMDWPKVSGGLLMLAGHGKTFAPLLRAAEFMVRHFEGLERNRLRFAENALEAVLLWCDKMNPANRRHRVDPRVLRVAEWIASEISAAHTVGSLARRAGLSESRLAHLFAADLKISIIAYIERRRMEYAAQLLEYTQRPIAEVADACGYHDPLYFSKRFKRYSGRSPLAFRSESHKHPART